MDNLPPYHTIQIQRSGRWFKNPNIYEYRLYAEFHYRKHNKVSDDEADSYSTLCIDNETPFCMAVLRSWARMINIECPGARAKVDSNYGGVYLSVIAPLDFTPFGNNDTMYQAILDTLLKLVIRFYPNAHKYGYNAIDLNVENHQPPRS